MPERGLRVALIGAGKVATGQHLPAWREQPGVRVTCVADREPGRAETVARDWDVPFWHEDYRAVLDRDDVDVVDVCLPPTLHGDATVAFLRAGKHVLVEKPMARASRTARAWSPPGTPARRCSWSPRTGRSPRPADGSAGCWTTACSASCACCALSTSRRCTCAPAPPGATVTAHYGVGGHLLNAGVHAVNLARELMGDYDTLFAFSSQPGRGPAPFLEGDIALAARFTSGALGSMALTGRARHARGRRLAFALFGDRGQATFELLSGRVSYTADGLRTDLVERRPSLGFAEEISHFVDCVRGAPCRSAAAPQLRTLAAVLAAYRSMHEGVPVRPAELLADAAGTSAQAGR